MFIYLILSLKSFNFHKKLDYLQLKKGLPKLMGRNKDCKLPGHCNYCRRSGIGNGGIILVQRQKPRLLAVSASKISVMDVHHLDKGATASAVTRVN